jgi:peptidoglycan/xylan/chitin deacetylase (PgdA/CDA1 family)
VNDDAALCADQDAMCVHVDAFRAQLQLLDRWGFTAITLKDYQLHRAGSLNLPKRPIVLTFDDGYKEVHTFALPLLREFGMTAVLFALGDRQVRTNTWDLPNGVPEAPLMNDQELLELHQAGIEIGSHGLRHRPLPKIAREEAWEEISRSRVLLEILLNAPVTSFAFPYGLSDEATKKMAHDAGYLTACGVYSGPGTFGVDDFDVRRILVPGSTSAAGFALRVLTPYQHYASLKWNFKSLLGLGRRSSAVDSPYGTMVTDTGKGDA